MKIRCLGVMTITLALFACGFAISSGGAGPVPKDIGPSTWEYKVVYLRDKGAPVWEEAFNKLGSEGWELAGTISTSNGTGNNPTPMTAGRAIMKRMKR